VVPVGVTLTAVRGSAAIYHLVLFKIGALVEGTLPIKVLLTVHLFLSFKIID